MHPEYKKLNANYYPILAQTTLRDGYGCANCGETRGAIVIDHILPVKLGGKTELENLQLLCHRCNNIKGSTFADYRPQNRGSLGYVVPRYTAYGALVIRVWHWRRVDRPDDARYKYLDGEVLAMRGKRSVHVLFNDGRKLNAQLRHVYPPDLQHLFVL